VANKKDPVKAEPRKFKPAMSPEEREDQIIAKAYDLVERRIDEGTATSQETTHFLKMGSRRERLEQDRIATGNQLDHAKVEALASAQRVEELYQDALAAFASYKGQDDYEVDDEYED